MASSGERRMVFDTRGRRKHVIRVVYAILALLMGASLFLVVGPFNFANLLGNQTSSGSSAKVFEEQAERIEGRLAKNPDDEAQQLALVRAKIGAGNAKVEVDPATGAKTYPLEAHEDFGAASRAWAAYLKHGPAKPSASTAQLVSATFFGAVESSAHSYREVEEGVAIATRAQQIVAEQRPSLGSIGTLAKYQYFNGEFAAGDRSAKQAAAKSPSKEGSKEIEKALNEFRKSAKEYAKRAKEATKLASKAEKESLTNPFSGLTGPGSTPGG